MDYCWIMTHPISLSLDAPLEMHLCTNARSQWGAWCVQLSALSLEMQPPHQHSILNDNAQTSWDFAIHSLRGHYSPCCSPSFFSSTLCATVCLWDSAYTSHCWHCWLSSILHPHPTPLSATGDYLLPNWWKEEPELLNGYFVSALIVLNVQL